MSIVNGDDRNCIGKKSNVLFFLGLFMWEIYLQYNYMTKNDALKLFLTSKF